MEIACNVACPLIHAIDLLIRLVIIMRRSTKQQLIFMSLSIPGFSYIWFRHAACVEKIRFLWLILETCHKNDWRENSNASKELNGINVGIIRPNRRKFIRKMCQYVGNRSMKYRIAFVNILCFLESRNRFRSIHERLCGCHYLKRCCS